jgi:hypothetical protein
MLIIEPYGRLGNNIIQIINCVSENLYKYKHDNIDIRLLKEKNKIILKNFPDYLLFDFPPNNEVIKNTFWLHLTIHKNQINFIINNFIKPYINYIIENENTYGINFDKDLIIHIRSGDIFNKNFPLDQYIQPPYSFYKNIIEKENFEYIYIFSENYNINPIIPKLLENYNNIKFISNDLDIDFILMLNSHYFVPSYSSLSMAINNLSNYKEKIYISYMWTKGYNNFNYEYYDYKDYFAYKSKSYDEKIFRLLNS